MSLDVTDLEPWDAWSEAPRRARKSHTCNGCSAAILPGEHYLAHSHVLDRHAASEHCCFACWWTREVFCENGLCTPSCLMEALREDGRGRRRGEPERQLLASVLRRYRVSAQGRRSLVERQAARAALWARVAARKAAQP